MVVNRLAEATVVVRHIDGDPAEAELIHRAMLNVVVEATGESYEIGSDVVDYARPRKKKPVSPARTSEKMRTGSRYG